MVAAEGTPCLGAHYHTDLKMYMYSARASQHTRTAG